MANFDSLLNYAALVLINVSFLSELPVRYGWVARVLFPGPFR